MNTLMTLLPLLSPIVVAIITGIYAIQQTKVQRRIETKQEEAEKRSKQRAKESLLNMEMANANTKLTIGVAMALKRGQANGEIEEGLKAVQEAEAKYNKFLKEVAIQDIVA